MEEQLVRATLDQALLHMRFLAKHDEVLDQELSGQAIIEGSVKDPATVSYRGLFNQQVTSERATEIVRIAAMLDRNQLGELDDLRHQLQSRIAKALRDQPQLSSQFRDSAKIPAELVASRKRLAELLSKKQVSK
jgi:hypothetical protein